MVYIMLADGFEEIEALAVVDILRRAEIDIKTVSADESEFVTGAHGIKIIPDIILSDVKDDIEMIILPGGMPGTLNLQNNKKLEKIILKSYDDGRYLAAICAAPMVYGQLNLLSGIRATCYPSFEKYLFGADVKKDKVCVDKNIITSKGAGTAHDFAFEIVKILKDESIALELKEAMQYE